MTEFRGIYTALLTPFRGGKIDEKAFQAFCEWQITEGVHGLVPCGTTGESPALSYDEHKRVIDLCVEVAHSAKNVGRVRVLAGTGANATDEAVMLTQHAKKSGADGVLSVVPYYNKPTAEGLYQHFKAIHDAVDIPMILYNVPGRTALNMPDEVMARLAQLPRIMGVKDATGDLARPYTLRAKAGAAFQQISGEDMTTVAFNVSGGIGCISVASNIMPKRCAEIQELTFQGKYDEARKMQDSMVELCSVLFCETSPGPVKFAASLMDKCLPDLRLPLVPPTEANQQKIRQALSNLSLI